MKLPSLLVILFTLSACSTNYYVDKPVKTLETQQKQTVYVTNPEHEDYDLLKKSKIYDITESQDSSKKLTIDQVESINQACGLDYLITAYSLGIVPFKNQTSVSLAYSLEEDGRTKKYEHHAKYFYKTSLWETFLIPFALSKNEAKARAFAQSEREEVHPTLAQK